MNKLKINKETIISLNDLGDVAGGKGKSIRTQGKLSNCLAQCKSEKAGDGSCAVVVVMA